MTPKQAKEITVPVEEKETVLRFDKETQAWKQVETGKILQNYPANPVNAALDRINYSKSFHYWQAFRWLITAIEENGYTVTITKKENKNEN